jgi:hypothetical protein
MCSRNTLVRIYSKALGHEPPGHPTDWDLIRGILDAEFPLPAVKLGSMDRFLD